MADNTTVRQPGRCIVRDHVGSNELHMPAKLLHTTDMADDRLRAGIAIRLWPRAVNDQCTFFARQRVAATPRLPGWPPASDRAGVGLARLFGRILQQM